MCFSRTREKVIPIRRARSPQTPTYHTMALAFRIGDELNAWSVAAFLFMNLNAASGFETSQREALEALIFLPPKGAAAVDTEFTNAVLLWGVFSKPGTRSTSWMIR